MAPAPRQASSERSVHASVRAPSTTTYSFAQQLPAQLTGLGRAPSPAPPPGAVPSPPKALAAPAGRWAAGLPKAATAAEVVANNTNDAGAQKNGDVGLSVDTDLDLYSRLIPTTSTVPRTPRRALGGGGLRGTGSIANGSVASSSRSALPNGTNVPLSHGPVIPPISVPSSLPARSLSPPSARMQKLSSEASPAQLARRATASTKQRRSSSPDIPSPIENEHQLPSQDETLSKPSPIQEPIIAVQKPEESPSSPQPQAQLTSRQLANGIFSDQQHSRPGAPEPVPLRRDQIEVLRSGGSSLSTSNTLPAPGPVPNTASNAITALVRGAQSTVNEIPLPRKSSSVAAKSPPLPRPQNARAEAMREAMHAKPSPSHSSKPVTLTRSSMGASLAPKRSSNGGNPARHSDGSVSPSDPRHSTDAQSITSNRSEAIFENRLNAVLSSSVIMSNQSDDEIKSSSPLAERVVSSHEPCGTAWNPQHSSGNVMPIDLAAGIVNGHIETAASSPPFVVPVTSAPIGHCGVSTTVPHLDRVSSSKLSDDRYGIQTMADAEMLVENLVGMDPDADMGALGVENMSLGDIMVGLYGGKGAGSYRNAPVDHEPTEDGLLPPLPNSEQEGVRFESMLRSMGWQPLDDEDTGVMDSIR